MIVLHKRVLRLWLVIFCFLVQHGFAAVDPVKVMSYNLLNYPSTSDFTADTTLRNPSFRTVVAGVNPDIFIAQEVISQAGVNGFLNNVMNKASSGFAAASFNDGPDTDNALFYRTSKFTFISNTPIHTALRDINEFKLRYIQSGDTIRIYSVHLKASNTASDEAQRAAEVDSLRKVTNALPLGSNFFVCGDFNIYNSTESAYVKLKQVVAGKEGQFIDPLTLSGSWNQSVYSQYHTQSPRVRSFGGGTPGGLDDRFDLGLYSLALSQAGGVDYLSGSLVVYGNDGNHYNDSINHPPNAAVSQTIAQALHDASDHLPIYFTLNFNYSVAAVVDAGVNALITPSGSMCPNAQQNITVNLRNFGTTSIDFSATNIPVEVKVTDPAQVITTYTTTLSIGTLASGASTTVNFNVQYNMSAAGSYSFKSYSKYSSDSNHSNDTNTTAVIVYSVNTADITPPGSHMICNGNSILFTATSGSSYLWSDGATTPTINVSSAGSYTVTVTDVHGCSAVSSPVSVTVSNGQPSGGIVFTETMGNPGGTVTIATHNTNHGFDNDSYTMSGSGDVRITTPSSYPGASGNGNIFLTNVANRNFIISGINTSGLDSLQLSFGIYKNSTTATGSDLEVRVSNDGTNYTALSYPALPTGTGTGIWHYRTATGIIPSTSSLYIQFINLGTTTQYRIDDVKLTYSGSPVNVTSFNPANGNAGTNVTINGKGFNNASTVQFNGSNASFTILSDTQITAVAPVAVTTGPIRIDTYSCNHAISNTNFTVQSAGITLHVSLYIEGLYSAGMMLSDTVTIELHDPSSPFNLFESDKEVISTQGDGTFNFPLAMLNSSYYIVIRHRNSLATWSSTPVLFNSSIMSFNLKGL